jgi:hypothetical protein
MHPATICQTRLRFGAAGKEVDTGGGGVNTGETGSGEKGSAVEISGTFTVGS